MKHLIIDFETFGQDTRNCVVTMMAAFIFDDDDFKQSWFTPQYIIDKTQVYKFDVEHQKKEFDYKIDKSTMDFWLNQPKEVLTMFKPSNKDLTINEFFDKFIEYLSNNPKIDYWWSRSNTFDPPILTRLAKDSGREEDLNQYLKYWNVRDTRTFVDVASGFTLKNNFVPIEDEAEWNRVFTEHDPKCDIMADVMRMKRLTE